MEADATKLKPTQKAQPIPLREELAAETTSIERRAVLNYTLLRAEGLANHCLINNVGLFDVVKEVDGKKYKVTFTPLEADTTVGPKEEQK